MYDFAEIVSMVNNYAPSPPFLFGTICSVDAEKRLMKVILEPYGIETGWCKIFKGAFTDEIGTEVLVIGIGGVLQQYIVVGKVLTGDEEDDSQSGENNENGNNGGGDNGDEDNNGQAQDGYELLEAVPCNQLVVANFESDEDNENTYFADDAIDFFKILLGMFDRYNKVTHLFDKDAEEHFSVKKAEAPDDYHYPEEIFVSAHQAAIAFTLTYKSETQDALGAICQNDDGWHFTKAYILPRVTEDEEENNKIKKAISKKVLGLMKESGFYALITTNDYDAGAEDGRYYVDEYKTVYFKH